MKFPEPLKVAIEACLEKKGLDLLVIDLKGLASFTDYFLICSANSTKHSQTISDYIVTELKKHDLLPLSIEGEDKGDWILIDYGEFIVHIFTPQTRRYYSLESLWADAESYYIDEHGIHSQTP